MGIKIESRPDLLKLVNDAAFEVGFSSFYDYLETLVNFLENERQKHNKNIAEITEKIQSGEIKTKHAKGQVPPPLEYDYYRLGSIAEFENMLFSSFFVNTYFYLESELTRHCHDLENQNQEVLSLSDIVGNGVQRALTYLVKVHHIEFSLVNNPEWEKIQSFNVLRNCIVHNQGRLDEGFERGRERLLKFIQKPTSRLHLEDTLCVLNKHFCLDALDTIKSFLYSVTFAKTKGQ